MKARQVKKIMKNKTKLGMRINKMLFYWTVKWLAYELRVKRDHRIVQAISKTKKK